MLKKTTKLLSFVALFTILSIAFGGSKAHAASINVVAGTDALYNNDQQCQLSEAITSINDGGDKGDCVATGDYGVDDTINLPSGTITLTDNLPSLEQSVTIQGQGTGQTIIDGAGMYSVLQTVNGTLSVYDLNIVGFRDESIQATESSSLHAERLEIDGTNSLVGDDLHGIGFYSPSTDATRSLFLRDVYIHDITSDGDNAEVTTGVSINNAKNTHLDVVFDRVTISRIINADSRAVGISLVSTEDFTPSTITASLSNTTIDTVTSSAASAVGLAMAGFVSGANTTIDTVGSNLTITHVDGTFDPLYQGDGAAIVLAGAAGQPADTVSINYEATNNLLSNNDLGCVLASLNPIFGGQGTVTNTLTSLGGNISDDDTCSSYFTQPTDQNNVNPTDLHLGTLGDHGGSVPTIPLLEGSIAIDSGVTVNGLTTDARGISRPQCAAYDSGAYEYNGTCPASNNTTTPLTYPNPITGSTVTLELPSDVTNGTVSPISPNAIPKDSVFTYPLGLTTFTFNTTIGATKTITLYYDLPGDPSSYTARKYNTTTKTFSTIPNATITRTTYNNKSMIKLTYDITDGGPLDQDNTANGTIIDPVGLAQASVGVPNTGL